MGSLGTVQIIGVNHNQVQPQELVKFIEHLATTPQLICVEAPKGLIDITEHQAAQQYSHKHNLNRIGFIDQRPTQYDGGEYFGKTMEEIPPTEVELEPGATHEDWMEARTGQRESKNPEFTEFNREREQMMALELIEEMESGYTDIVAIVGANHTRNIVAALQDIERKYR